MAAKFHMVKKRMSAFWTKQIKHRLSRFYPHPILFLVFFTSPPARGNLQLDEKKCTLNVRFSYFILPGIGASSLTKKEGLVGPPIKSLPVFSASNHLANLSNIFLFATFSRIRCCASGSFALTVSLFKFAKLLCPILCRVDDCVLDCRPHCFFVGVEVFDEDVFDGFFCHFTHSFTYCYSNIIPRLLASPLLLSFMPFGALAFTPPPAQLFAYRFPFTFKIKPLVGHPAKPV